VTGGILEVGGDVDGWVGWLMRSRKSLVTVDLETSVYPIKSSVSRTDVESACSDSIVVGLIGVSMRIIWFLYRGSSQHRKMPLVVRALNDARRMNRRSGFVDGGSGCTIGDSAMVYGMSSGGT